MRAVSKVLAFAGAALMGVVAVTAGTVPHSSTTSDRVASARTQAVIKLDHRYHEMKAAAANATAARRTAVDTITSDIPYDYDTATMLFWHSVSAYCTDNANLDDWSCASCNQFGPFTVTGVMDDTTNQGYVGYFTQGLPASPIPGLVDASAPFVVVSFRGTVPSDLADWIEDLSFSKFAAFSTAYPDVSVHSGFWESYQSMVSGMMPALNQALSASGASTILFTGHSLGAAMAELAAIDIKINNPTFHVASYTQGTPRTGNAAFSQLYTQLIDASFREIHYHDIVAHLPPELLGFSHAPMEIWFDEAFDSYMYCNSTMDGEDPNCSDSVLLPISISDHTTYRGISVGDYCSSSLAITPPRATRRGAAPIATAPKHTKTAPKVAPKVTAPKAAPVAAKKAPIASKKAPVASKKAPVAPVAAKKAPAAFGKRLPRNIELSQF